MASSRPTTEAFWEAYFKDSSNDTRCRSGINNNVFVAVLIATVTFSAPFTIQDTSHVYSAFYVFLYFDAAAFAASMLAVLYAITCSPYSTAVADKQMLMLTRIIYVAIYSCVGAFCAAVVLIIEKASLDEPGGSVTSDRPLPDMVHAQVMTAVDTVHAQVIIAVIGALFLLSLIPAFLWFFCKHQYFAVQLWSISVKSGDDANKLPAGSSLGQYFSESTATHQQYQLIGTPPYVRRSQTLPKAHMPATMGEVV